MQSMEKQIASAEKRLAKVRQQVKEKTEYRKQLDSALKSTSSVFAVKKSTVKTTKGSVKISTKPKNRVRYADDFKDGDRTPKQYSYLRSLDKEWLDNRERELGNRISKAEAKKRANRIGKFYH
jgi:hypothetical protein